MNESFYRVIGSLNESIIASQSFGTTKRAQEETKESHPMKVAWYPRQIAVDTFMEVSLAVKETKLVVSRPGRSGIIGSRAALAFFSDTGPPNLLFPFQPKSSFCDSYPGVKLQNSGKNHYKVTFSYCT